MATLTAFNQACPHDDSIITSERYAENLRQALTKEISTPSGAHDFLRTTYPTATMKGNWSGTTERTNGRPEKTSTR